MAVVGDILTAPESTWQRIDDTDSNIVYGDYWGAGTNSKCYNSTYHQCQQSSLLSDGNIKFNFYGTKLRIIGIFYSQYSNNIEVKIDGAIHGIMDCSDTTVTSGVNQAITYEVLGLEEKGHTVELTMINKTTLGYVLDAIDIDETGYMLNPPVNVGEQLLTPETGWKRIDDTDTLILKNPTATGQYSGDIIDSSCYNGSTYQMLEGTISFYAYTSRLRIIGFRSITSMYAKDIEVYIDGVKNGTFSNLGSSVMYQCLLYDSTIGEGTHEIVIKNAGGAYVNFDCIDIDENGYLLTESEYNKTDKYPVMIGDDTIVSETNIANYASTLTGGERQLLIADKLQALYVTDGNGGYVKVANDGLTSDDLTAIETKLTTEVTNNVKTDFFSKTDTIDYMDNALSNKVDKVDGYGLSENNFSNSYKNTLDNLNLDNVVTDADYVHTDNNFTNIYKMKLDNLTNDSKYIGLFDTITDRDSYSGALSVGLWCSVLADDNYGSKKTKYIYDGTQWNYAGTYNDDAFLIDDSATTDTNVGWSANKITNELKAKANKSETDTAIANINTELDKKLEVSNLKQGTNVSLDVDQYGNVTINATTGDSTGGSGTSDYELLSNKPKINGVTVLGDKSAKDLKLLSDSYASTENEGSVKMADKAKTIDVTDQLIGSAQYYGVGNGGTLSDTALRLRPFPVGTATNRIDTLDFDLLTKDVTQSIPFIRAISDVNCIVQAFKKEDDELNVTESFEDYTNELVSNHSENVNCDITNGLGITDIHTYSMVINSDGMYESDIIDKNDFIEIIGLEMK